MALVRFKVIQVPLLVVLVGLFALSESNEGLRHRLRPRCKNRCDNHRTRGWRGEFEVNCDKWYHTDWERNYCRNECKFCPPSICNRTKPNIFNCPSTDIEGRCKDRCDSNRKKGNLDGYILNCDEAYFNDPAKIEECNTDCASCPVWVCNSTENTNLFYCPTGSYQETCKMDCDHYRKLKFGNDQETTHAFQFLCTELSGDDKTTCQNWCGHCPKMICDPARNNNLYNCPSLSDPTPIPTTASPRLDPEYGGRCKKRCDKFRLGGGGSYSFRCLDLFKADTDQAQCENDCEHCPVSVCDSDRSPITYNCPSSYEGDMLIVGLVGAVAVAILMTGLWIRATCTRIRQSGIQGQAQVVTELPVYSVPQLSSTSQSSSSSSDEAVPDVDKAIDNSVINSANN